MRNTVVDVLAGVAVLIAAGAAIEATYSVFRPVTVAIDYKTFKQSQSYNDGMAKDLGNFQLSYLQASGAQQQALRAVVLDRFSGYDDTKLSPNLREFLTQLRNGN